MKLEVPGIFVCLHLSSEKNFHDTEILDSSKPTIVPSKWRWDPRNSILDTMQWYLHIPLSKFCCQRWNWEGAAIYTDRTFETPSLNSSILRMACNSGTENTTLSHIHKNGLHSYQIDHSNVFEVGRCIKTQRNWKSAPWLRLLETVQQTHSQLHMTTFTLASTLPTGPFD